MRIHASIARRSANGAVVCLALRRMMQTGRNSWSFIVPVLFGAGHAFGQDTLDRDLNWDFDLLWELSLPQEVGRFAVSGGHVDIDASGRTYIVGVSTANIRGWSARGEDGCGC